jgi:hypothetical protein
MVESEKEYLHEIAVEEFKKNWPLGLVWLVVVLFALGLMFYGGYKATFG